MKQYIKFILLTLFMTFFIFELVIISILKYPAGVFYSSYQSLIQDKYRILKETNEPKIIMVAGSSSAFGLNQKMLEDATGYKVANLGLHAGFGPLFYSELAKANINEGDIVLLGYEYGWENGFDDLDQNLIMTGIDDDISIYTRIPVNKWDDFIGYIFKYAEIKNGYAGATGNYSREAFDSQTGQMIFPRDYEMEYSVEEYNQVSITGDYISESSIKYLVDFKEYIEKQGASVYFVAPPLIIDSVICDFEEFNKLKANEENLIGIEYISNPTDYLFPCKYMSNALYHCNSVGEDIRTEYLIEDLKRANVIQ